MLTPIDIQAKSFKSGMGYSKQDVDSFLTNLYSDYEILYRENIDLKNKFNVLNETINRYKDIEKSLQKALVLAETTAEETIAAAKTNAAVIEQEAKVKAEEILADAKKELDHTQTTLLKLVQSYESYKAQYRSLANAQLELIDSPAFQIELAKVENLVENTPIAQPLFQDAPTKEKSPAPVEEDMDETVSMEDDSMIKDIASIFDK